MEKIEDFKLVQEINFISDYVIINISEILEILALFLINNLKKLVIFVPAAIAFLINSRHQ